jgi:plastocyanin
MKAKYIAYVCTIAVILLFVFSGCKKTGEVVDQETGTTANASQQNQAETNVGGTKVDDVKALLKNLSKEAGLPTDEEEEETVDEGGIEEETTETSEHTILVANFKGTPSDLKINVGDTVVWKDEMENYKIVILVLPELNDSNVYSSKEINDAKETFYNESYSFTFTEAGEYKWGAKPKFDKIYGFITVK